MKERFEPTIIIQGVSTVNGEISWNSEWVTIEDGRHQDCGLVDVSAPREIDHLNGSELTLVDDYNSAAFLTGDGKSWKGKKFYPTKEHLQRLREWLISKSRTPAAEDQDEVERSA